MSLVINFDDIPDDEEYVFELVEKPDYFKVDPEEGILKKDVCVEGSLSKVGREILFKGNISTEMEMVCSRCLEPLSYKIRSKVLSRYVPGQEVDNQDTDVELHASDIEMELYSDNQIDLTQAVYDQMMLSLPLTRLCREDCKGICLHCGVNQNKKNCQCSDKDSIDPRLAVLETLKDKLK
jgi:DUF177 domain-containing protein